MTVIDTPPSGPASPGLVAHPQKPKYYRFSVLITGIGRFFRGFVPFLVVIVINAVLQAALIWPDIVPARSMSFVLTAVASFIVLVVSFSLLNATALSAATGRVSLKRAFGKSRQHFFGFFLWSVIVYVLLLAGLIVNIGLGLLVLLLLPFVTLAATDGRKNAIGANFRAIGNRFGRYVITVLILGFLAIILSYLVSAVIGFFVGGDQPMLSAFITWLYWGVTASWVLSSLGALYRSTWVGAPSDPIDFPAGVLPVEEVQVPTGSVLFPQTPPAPPHSD